MMYTIIEAEEYHKPYQRFAKKHPDLKEKYLKTLQLLKDNPYHPSLRLHKIDDVDNDFTFSISINIKYRIIILLKIADNRVYLVNIGTHEEVY